MNCNISRTGPHVLFRGFMLATTLALAQSAPEKQVPITQEPSHHLVLDNEYVRVFQVEVAPHASTLIHRHDMDYIFVTLGDSVVENERVGEKPVRLELKDGDTRFTKGGFAHKAVNLSDKPFRNLTIELKKTGESGNECDLEKWCQESSLVAFIKPYTVDRFEIVSHTSILNIDEFNPALLIAVSDVALEVKSVGEHGWGKLKKEVIRMKRGEVHWCQDEIHEIYNLSNWPAKLAEIEVAVPPQKHVIIRDNK